jgi:hypothetical protein
MSKVFIEETTLTNIGAAIREKTGKTELIAPGNMPAEIRGIVSGGGTEVEPLVITGGYSYSCSGSVASQYIKLFGNTMSTQDLTTANNMFYNYRNESIPFDINFRTGMSHDMTAMFDSADRLKTLPKIYNAKPSKTASMFNACSYLREIPESFGEAMDWSELNNSTSAYTGATNGMFASCYSLRKIPMSMIRNGNPAAAYSYTYLNNLGYYNYALDELADLPLEHIKNTTYTYNPLGSSFCSYASRVKRITFALNSDGHPYTVKWKQTTMDLSNFTGYCNMTYNITTYNSGITADKEVKDDATYQALKNDPDWFSIKVEYSRYNHDSAVETINSLPDTSAYLATAGGTNTIKFKGASGSKTDGGAINTLTEAEIAVAAAKGWTVTFA